MRTMGKRTYDGKPIDMSWKDSPWMNDGETVDVHDSEGDGEMKTIDWPEGATPKEELNDNQIKAIKTAAQYPDIDNSGELADLAGIDDKSVAYVGSILRRHWPSRYWGFITTKSGEEIDMARKALLNGGTCREVAKQLDSDHGHINRIIKHEHPDKNTTTRPLEFDRELNKWVESEPVEKRQTQEQSKTNNKEWGKKGVPDSEIENIRRMGLDGMTARKIAKAYDVGQSAIQNRLNGSVGDDTDSEIPPLEYSPEKNCWEVSEDDDSKEQTMLDTTPDNEQEKTHVEEEIEITTPESDTGSQTKTLAVVAAFIGFVVGFVIKTLGDSE